MAILWCCGVPVSRNLEAAKNVFFDQGLACRCFAKCSIGSPSSVLSARFQIAWRQCWQPWHFSTGGQYSHHPQITTTPDQFSLLVSWDFCLQELLVLSDQRVPSFGCTLELCNSSKYHTSCSFSSVKYFLLGTNKFSELFFAHLADNVLETLGIYITARHI